MNHSKNIISKYIIVVLLLSVAFFSYRPVVGFDHDELLLTFDWSNNILFQGDSGNVTIVVESFCPNKLKVNWIGIHFSWMNENNYYALDFSSTPQIVANGSLTSLGTIEFIVPLDVPIGLIQYYVMIYYKENESDIEASKAWTSQTYEIQIHDHYERIFNTSRPSIWDSIKAADYENATAKDLHVQAAEEYNFSIMLADQGLWEDAVAYLLNSSHILAKASSIEMKHWRCQAFELINTIVNNANQSAYECSEVESLLSQARSLLLEAQSNFSMQTLDGYKRAFYLASEAKSYVELAFAKEEIYIVKKQEAIDKINNVALILNQTSFNSPISDELLGKAQELLSRSQDALVMRTVEGCETAFLYAEQALSIGQAAEGTPVYHVQAQQQPIFNIIGYFAIGVLGLTFIIKPKKGEFSTFFLLLSAISSSLFKNTKTNLLKSSSPVLLFYDFLPKLSKSKKDKIQSADNFQGNDDSIAKLIRQALDLCEDEFS